MILDERRTVEELQAIEEKLRELVAEMPGPDDGVGWLVLESELYGAYVDLAYLGERSVDEVKSEVFRARDFALEAFRGCKDRKEIVKRTAREAGQYLSRAWHTVQDAGEGERK